MGEFLYRYCVIVFAKTKTVVFIRLPSFYLDLLIITNYSKYVIELGAPHLDTITTIYIGNFSIVV